MAVIKLPTGLFAVYAGHHNKPTHDSRTTHLPIVFLNVIDHVISGETALPDFSCDLFVTT